MIEVVVISALLCVIALMAFSWLIFDREKEAINDLHELKSSIREFEREIARMVSKSHSIENDYLAMGYQAAVHEVEDLLYKVRGLL